MKLNKKQRKILIWILIIIGLLSSGLLVFKYISVWYGLNEFSCSFTTENKLICSASGSSMEGSPYGTEGYIEFNLKNPYNLYFKQFENFNQILIEEDYNFAQFFNINSEVCYFAGGNYRIKAGENYNDIWKNTIDDSLRFWSSSWDDGCYGLNGGRYELHPSNIISKKFPNQLMIVKGQIRSREYPEQNPVYVPYITYGFCDLVGDGTNSKCKIYEPVLNEWKEQRYASIDSAEIILKIGGYIESEINCPQNGLEKCEGNILFKCINYYFVNQGKIEGKCGIEKCNENELKCSGNDLLICQNNQFILKEICEKGCENNKCKEDNFITIIIVLIIIGIIIGGLIYLYKKTKK